MRINVYTEELPDQSTPMPHVEIVQAKYISSRSGEEMTNYGLRVYLKSSPDLHYVPPRDDDRSAITFWCGSKQTNLYQFVEILKLAVETDNLDRWRDRVNLAASEAEKKL